MLVYIQTSVMWSETVGLRTIPVWDQKIGLSLGLGLAGFVLYCVVKHDLVTLVVIMILEDTAAFQVGLLFLVSLFCAWNITTVEINSGVQLLKS